MGKVPRQKEQHVQVQGGRTTQALSSSRTLTGPAVRFTKIGLEQQAGQQGPCG